MLRPPTLTLFPYTTLFRSVLAATDKGGLLLVGRMPRRYRGPVDTGRSRRPLPASGATGHGRCGGGIGVARVLLNLRRQGGNTYGGYHKIAWRRRKVQYVTPPEPVQGRTC